MNGDPSENYPHRPSLSPSTEVNEAEDAMTRAGIDPHDVNAGLEFSNELPPIRSDAAHREEEFKNSAAYRAKKAALRAAALDEEHANAVAQAERDAIAAEAERVRKERLAALMQVHAQNASNRSRPQEAVEDGSFMDRLAGIVRSIRSLFGGTKQTA